MVLTGTPVTIPWLERRVGLEVRIARMWAAVGGNEPHQTRRHVNHSVDAARHLAMQCIFVAARAYVLQRARFISTPGASDRPLSG